MYVCMCVCVCVCVYVDKEDGLLIRGVVHGGMAATVDGAVHAYTVMHSLHHKHASSPGPPTKQQQVDIRPSMGW